MSCPEKIPCPEVKQVIQTPAITIMPRQSDLVRLLRQTNLTVNDDGSIESDTPIEGLRQEGSRYYLDWIPCTWKLLNIKLPKISASCMLQLDTTQCATCPRRHTSK
jgi:hypothetical protein